MRQFVPFYIASRHFSKVNNKLAFGSWVSRIATFGLIITISLLVVVLSVMNGFDKELRKTILSVIPHIQIIDEGGILDWEQKRSNILSNQEVIEVTPFNEINGLLVNKKLSQPMKILGISQSHIPNGIKNIIDNDGLNSPKFGQILLSQKVAKKLNIQKLDMVNLVIPETLDSSIEVHSFQIAGLFNSHSEIDKYIAISSLRQVGEIHGFQEEIFGFRLQIVDEFRARELGREIISKFSAGTGFRDWIQTHGNLYQAIQLSKRLIVLLMLLLIGVSVFNIVSMLMMSVLSKKRDIAVLQTLGLSRFQIIQTYMISGSMIGMFGIIIGVGLGISFCALIPTLAQWVEYSMDSKLLDTSVYPFDYIPVYIDVMDIVNVSSVAFIFTILASIFPAIRASKVLPAKELRYD